MLTTSIEIVADFVFVIDCSSSMQQNIDAVRAGMPSFVSQIQAKKTDAQFAVVLFGATAAEVILDWTASVSIDDDFMLIPVVWCALLVWR
jgi:Mg-chelatase subunit ChlD